MTVLVVIAEEDDADFGVRQMADLRQVSGQSATLYRKVQSASRCDAIVTQTRMLEHSVSSILVPAEPQSICCDALVNGRIFNQ